MSKDCDCICHTQNIKYETDYRWCCHCHNKPEDLRNPPIKFDAENVASFGTDQVHRTIWRTRVYGGWIVNNIFDDLERNIHSETSVFVPDPNKQWRPYQHESELENDE